MGVAASIGRWFKALGYLLTGRIDAAREAGLTPLKLNTVVLRGENEEELPALAAFAGLAASRAVAAAAPQTRPMRRR